MAFNALRVGIGAAFADGNHLLHTADIGRTCFNGYAHGILTPTVAYEVKADDTMGVIAGKFDVDLDVLLEYNALTDPNALSVGQIIYIPVTQAPTEEPTPRRTATPQGTVSYGSPTQAPADRNRQRDWAG